MSITQLSDPDLVASFSDLVAEEQENLAAQLEHIAELDRRRLFFGYSSLWAYLIEEKKFSDDMAERRIKAARMLRRIPSILPLLKSGNLNLTHVDLALACANREKLNDSQLGDLLGAVSGMTTRRARKEIATRYPWDEEEIRHDRIRPITAELSEVTFVANQALLDQLDEIRGLLAHAHPKLKLAELIGLLATEYWERHHPEAKARRAAAKTADTAPLATAKATPKATPKATAETTSNATAKTTPPAAPRVMDPRFPPVSLVHELISKTGYRCAYVDSATKQPCSSTFALQIDHIRPWAKGGKTELSNLRFLCRGHHARVSFLEFGENRNT